MNKEEVVRTLERLEVYPSKGRGQNFLIDDRFLDSIIDFGKPATGETLVEIGPGLGVLSKELARITPLVAIEIEPKFCEFLRSELPEIEVLEEDIRLVDFGELGDKVVVFGNVPYSLSTEILLHLIGQASVLSRAILLLQLEFAERIAAEPGSRKYGSISVATQLWCQTRLGPVAEGDCFYPPADVTSRLLELRFSDEPRYGVRDQITFQSVVRTGFNQRRRKLQNALLNGNLWTREQLEQAFDAVGISGEQRAESLSVKQFADLSNALVVD